MRFLLLLPSLVYLVSACGYDYTCGGFQENAKMLKDLGNPVKTTAAQNFSDRMIKFYQGYPTNGEQINCVIDGQEKIIVFSQKEQERQLNLWEMAKMAAEGLPY